MVVTTTAPNRQHARNRPRRKRWFRSRKTCKASVSLSRWSVQNSICFILLAPHHKTISAGAWRSACQFRQLAQQSLGTLEPIVGGWPIAGHNNLLIGAHLHGACMLADELDQLNRIRKSVVAG